MCNPLRPLSPSLVCICFLVITPVNTTLDNTTLDNTTHALQDSTRLVLRPLARMMAMVKDVSNNPLGRQSYAPLQLADKDHLYEPRILEHCIGMVGDVCAY